jgi:hypothetical protein
MCKQSSVPSSDLRHFVLPSFWMTCATTLLKGTCKKYMFVTMYEQWLSLFMWYKMFFGRVYNLDQVCSKNVFFVYRRSIQINICALYVNMSRHSLWNFPSEKKRTPRMLTPNYMVNSLAAYTELYGKLPHYWLRIIWRTPPVLTPNIWRTPPLSTPSLWLTPPLLRPSKAPLNLSLCERN